MNAVTGKAMSAAWILIALATVPGQPPVAKDDAATQESARTKRERLLEIYASEAREYTIYRDATHKERVELRPEPVYVWTNPVRSKGQDGVVYVWTCRGGAEVLSSFFSFPATGPRSMAHEFQSLSLSALDVEHAGTPARPWTPLAAGIDLAPIPAAPAPGPSAAQRLPQMRRSRTISPPRPWTNRTGAGSCAC